MTKAFLSHSSADKQSYVEIVAKKLRKEDVIYDNFTFEEGEKNIDEILNGLNDTDLFVFFISNSSLNSEWVQREILEAKGRLNKKIKKIYPIIIDSNITYKDSRIPDWLRDNYNLKLVTKTTVTAQRIKYKLREISFENNNSNLEIKDNFVGRTDKLKEFEERIYDFDKNNPITVFVSGLSGVGRRTFIKQALYKTNLIDKYYEPLEIVLEKDISIEDFILKLNDLGLIDFNENDLHSLSNYTIEEKQKIVKDFIDVAYKNNEVVFIVDEGCIVNYRREISKWFSDIIYDLKDINSPVFCIASKYNINYKSHSLHSDRFLHMDLNEFTVEERKWLLTKLLGIYRVEIDKEQYESVTSLLFGLPKQIFYAVDVIRQDNASPFFDKLPIIREYNNNKAALLLSKYESDINIMEFIRLLAELEVMDVNFLFSIVSEEEYYPLVQELASSHIIELMGIEGELLRLADVIRDYVKRNRLSLSTDFENKIKNKVEEVIKSEDILDTHSSIYTFTLKESLKRNLNIDKRLLFPSHYLKCMKDLYNGKRHYKRVIDLADLILSKEENIDSLVVQDIRHYLCLALARRKDNRFHKEIREIQGDEHNFLYGFYYRLCGRYDESLERLNKVVDAKYVSSRAKREIVQVYVQIEEYDKAMEYAKRNFEENQGNQFHTQAYFNCLINSENPKDHEEEMQRLIKQLHQINSEQSNEMVAIAEALFTAKVNNNRIRAFDNIKDCVSAFDNSHYPLLALCDIAIKYRDEEELKQAISSLSKFHVSSRTINRYKAFLYALEGDLDNAKKLINEDIARFPSHSKFRILERLDMYYRNEVDSKA